MQRLKKPSPAMVIAIIALFVAMGGTGYAALKLPKNSVGSKQIKKNAVSSSKVKNGSLKAGDFAAGQLPAGAQGAKGDKGDKGDAGTNGTNGTNGLNATKLLGSIQANGNITRQQGLTNVAHTGGSGTYTLTWNQDISQCYPVANIFGSAGYVVMTGITTNQLFISTFNSVDPPAAADRAFYVAVLC